MAISYPSSFPTYPSRKFTKREQKTLETVKTGTVTLTNKTLTSPVLTTPQINDTSADHQYVFAVSELTADRTVTLPLLTGNDTFTFNAFAATLTNKTLTSPVLTTPQINDTSADHQYVFAVNELVADRTVTLPLLTGNDEFTFNAHTQTLSNKTLTAPQINDTSSDHQYIFGVSELTADRTVTLPLLTGNDTFVFAAFTQTLTNKTLTSPVLTTPQINDTSADHQYVFAVSELTDDRTVTLPLLTGNDEFTFNDHTQTLTNKTLTSAVLTTPQINDTSADHQYIFAVSELTADRTVTLPLLTGNDTFVFNDFAATLTNKTLTSPVLTTPQINDTSADHQYVFAVSELTDDRTVTLPLLTGNDEFVFKDHTQILTNKTLTAPQINDTSADHQYIFGVSELTADRTVTLPLLTGNDTFVFNDFAATLTNKTLTSAVLTTPQINDTSSDHQYVFAVSELTSDRTVTLPLLTGNDEFVFKDHTQTLTNKTLTSPIINSIDWKEATGTLSATQVRNLHTTPVSLVAAVDASTTLILDEIQLYYVWNSVAFDSVGAGDDLQIEYSGGTDILRIETVGFIDQTNDEHRWAKADYYDVAAGTPGGIDNNALANQGIQALALGQLADTDNDSDGDCTIKYKVIYKEVAKLT